MTLISLYSLRGLTRSWARADYDPTTRLLTYREVHGNVGGLIDPIAVGDQRSWQGANEPWEGAGVVIATDHAGQAIGQAGPFPPLWERVTAGQEPSPGYGAVKNETESFCDNLFSAFGPLLGA